MKEIFDLLRFKYVNNIGEIHFTNLSFKLYIGIKFALVCVPSELRSKILLHRTNKTFFEYLPSQSQLQRWGGDVAYNIDNYVDNRCVIEDVDRSSTLLSISDNDLKESQRLLLNMHMKDKFIMQKMNHAETSSKRKLVVLENDFVFIYDTITAKMWGRHFRISTSEIRVVDNKIRIMTPIREFVFIANNVSNRDLFLQAFSRKYKVRDT